VRACAVVHVLVRWCVCGDVCVQVVGWSRGGGLAGRKGTWKWGDVSWVSGTSEFLHMNVWNVRSFLQIQRKFQRVLSVTDTVCPHGQRVHNYCLHAFVSAVVLSEKWSRASPVSPPTTMRSLPLLGCARTHQETLLGRAARRADKDRQGPAPLCGPRRPVSRVNGDPIERKAFCLNSCL
jgi:hypothetical protein